MIHVYPSGADFATSSEPMLPLAPARFSTTTRCARIFETPSATTRVTASALPPGELGTIHLIGFDGYVCAQLIDASKQMRPTSAVSNTRNLMQFLRHELRCKQDRLPSPATTTA